MVGNVTDNKSKMLNFYNHFDLNANVIAEEEQ